MRIGEIMRVYYGVGKFKRVVVKGWYNGILWVEGVFSGFLIIEGGGWVMGYSV